MEVTKEINGIQVIFEQGELVDRHGHSNEYQMNGYTGEELTHTGTGSYTYTGDFEELTDIEEI